MLWQFSTKNYKSFKDKAVLSLIASNYDKDTREEENVFINKKFGIRVLKSAIVYGANASGKSNLLDAISFMKRFVIGSSIDWQKDELIDVDPFRLNTESENEPSEFEVIFTYNGVLYRYGFEVNQVEVVSEWLFYKPKTKEVELFYRDYEQTTFHESKFNKGKTVFKQGLVRKNALILTISAQFNEELALEVINWFINIRSLSGIHGRNYQSYTIDRTKTPEEKKKIVALLKDADLGIHDIEVQMLTEDNIPSHFSPDVRDSVIKRIREGKFSRVNDVLFTHKKYGNNNEFVENVSFSLDKEESSGTQKYFNLIGSILDVLDSGEVLIVDELDAQLHPKLVCRIISLFNSSEFNSNNAQIIFNTHDTNLLDYGLFRRDQIWFTEKNKYGASRLYSLSDFSSEDVRKNEDYENNYIRGKYGAVPYFSSLDVLNEAITPYGKKRQGK